MGFLEALFCALLASCESGPKGGSRAASTAVGGVVIAATATATPTQTAAGCAGEEKRVQLQLDSYKPVHTELRRAESGCAQCHDHSTGNTSGFQSHSDADLKKAFNVAMGGLVNLADPPKSRIVLKVQQGHNCSPRCAETAKALQESIALFAKSYAAIAPSTCGGGVGKIVQTSLAEVSLTELKGSRALGKALRWEVELPGRGRAVIQATVYHVSDPVIEQTGYYLVGGLIFAYRNPPEFTGPRHVRVSNVQLATNGVVRQFNNFLGIRQVVPPVPSLDGILLGPVLSDQVQIVSMESDGLTEGLGFRFSVEDTADAPSPLSEVVLRRDLALRVDSDVFRPPLDTPGARCITCHAFNSTSTAFTKFAMGVIPMGLDPLERAVLAYMDLLDPRASLLLKKPLNLVANGCGTGSGPVPVPLTSAQMDLLEAWSRAEAGARTFGEEP